MDLNELRLQMDATDKDLVSLFLRRMEISAAIADYKSAHALPVTDEKREAQKLQAVSLLAGEEFSPDIQALYSLLFRLSKEYQNRLLAKEGE